MKFGDLRRRCGLNGAAMASKNWFNVSDIDLLGR